eukprot:scaffold10344_cov118-Isochrysis_galbana.AAC.1
MPCHTLPTCTERASLSSACSRASAAASGRRTASRTPQPYTPTACLRCECGSAGPAPTLSRRLYHSWATSTGGSCHQSCRRGRMLAAGRGRRTCRCPAPFCVAERRAPVLRLGRPQQGL